MCSTTEPTTRWPSGSLSQMLRSAWSIRRSSDPNGAASPNTSHSHDVAVPAVWMVPVYSGKLSAKRLTSWPSPA